jgi:hypothetical protein
MVPGRSTVSTKRAFAVGATLAVVNVTSYCFHVCVTPEIRPGERRRAVLALDCCGDRPGEARRRLREEGRAIPAVRPDRNAPVALIGNASRVSSRRLRDMEAQARRERRVERLTWSRAIAAAAPSP